MEILIFSRAQSKSEYLNVFITQDENVYDIYFQTVNFPFIVLLPL